MNKVKNALGQTFEDFMKTYDPNMYADQKPSVTSDILIFTVQNRFDKAATEDAEDMALKILLIQRSDFPEINKWALPGGFIEKNETALEAAKRELEEETGLSDIYLEQLYSWDDVNRDVRDRVISFSHMALVDSSRLHVVAGSDAKDVRWFEVSKRVIESNKTETKDGFVREKVVGLTLRSSDIRIQGRIKETVTVKGRMRSRKLEVLDKEKSELAFDHVMMIYYGLQRLKNKVEYTDIAFNLLPKEFTIAEAYKVFQLTTGVEYTNQNFRKKYGYMMNDLGKNRDNPNGRPSKLFQLNINWDEDEE